jgi:hypothetical protein
MFEEPHLPLGGTEESRWRYWRRYALTIGVLVLAFAIHEASDTYGKAASRAADQEGAAVRRRGAGPRSDYRPPARPNGALAPGDVREYRDAPLYDAAVLRTIFLQFESEKWEEELASRYRSDTELPATITIDGAVYRDVGVHFRGNSSYRMVPSGYKRSLNLSFDYVHRNQHVGGYRTLNLLNANSDPSFVRTVLYSEIARKYIPAPKVNFVRVAINGESWGIYLNVQQFNKDFVRDFYGTAGGARWKVPGSPRARAGLEYLGEDAATYRSRYEIKTKDTTAAWNDLIRLCRLLDRTPPEKLEAVLAPHLNVDGALRFLALEMALVNTDGYWIRASDYSIYQDEKRKFHILPYDFNEAMGVQGPGRRGNQGSGVAVDPLTSLSDVAKPLRSKLLAVPRLREQYLQYVREIAEQWMDWAKLAPLVQQYQQLIEADVKADGRKLYAFEAFEPSALQRFFEQRRAYLLEQSRKVTP